MRRHGHDLFSYSAVYRLCSLSLNVCVQASSSIFFFLVSLLWLGLLISFPAHFFIGYSVWPVYNCRHLSIDKTCSLSNVHCVIVKD